MEGTESTSTERCTLRYLVAQIVLATDLPMPHRFSQFNDDSISLDFRRVDEALAWASFLGATAQPYINTDGHRYAGAMNAKWHGWRIQINANEPVEPDAGLDADTTVALREVES